MLHDGSYLLFQVTDTQLDAAAKVCARAFMNDAQVEYFLPERQEREKKLHLFYALLLRYGLRYGKVYASSQKLEGVIIWLSSAESTMSLWKLLRCGVLGMAWQAGISRILKLLRFTGPVFKLHKECAPFPHEYLFLLAVDPQYQGQGFARKLLQPRLRDLDKQKISCFLETHTQSNVAMYQKFGFNPVSKISIAQTKLNFWGMVREPTV